MDGWAYRIPFSSGQPLTVPRDENEPPLTGERGLFQFSAKFIHDEDWIIPRVFTKNFSWVLQDATLLFASQLLKSFKSFGSTGNKNGFWILCLLNHEPPGQKFHPPTTYCVGGVVPLIANSGLLPWNSLRLRQLKWNSIQAALAS